MPKSTTITEIEEFEPERVDGVGKGANGFPILMLKSIGGDSATIDNMGTDASKADDSERATCKSCEGSGKTADDGQCAACAGTGKAPKVGESMKQFLENVTKETGVAPSGAEVNDAGDCPTCNGNGVLNDGSIHGTSCPDCGGTGQNQLTVNPVELNAVPGDPGRISEGDPQGREKIDKGDPDGFRPEPYSPDADETVQCPKCERMNDVDAAYCDQCGHELMGDDKVRVGATKAVSLDGATFSGKNPSDMPVGGAPDASAQSDPTQTPGSPEWEAVDAATATQAAQTLAEAAELIRTFAQRESMEVAAGEGNDNFDAGAAAAALAGVSQAIGIMAQLAFHEGLEAQKSLEDAGLAKAGKRLSGKTVAALATARDHLNDLLGDDDPANAQDDGDDAVSRYIESANKALLNEEIQNMTTDELTKVLNARDERLVEILADVLKGKSADDNSESIANAKDANKKSKKKSPKAEMTDLEDEAEQGDAESANTSPEGAAKSEETEDEEDLAAKADLTPEEIEAKQAAREAKKALKAARKAEKEAAEAAAVQKAIAEGVAEATEAVRTLQERLATVEKMAAPSSIVRTRPQDALTKSVERDELEIRLAALERISRETPDADIRKAKREEIAEIRTQIAALSTN